MHATRCNAVRCGVLRCNTTQCRYGGHHFFEGGTSGTGTGTGTGKSGSSDFDDAFAIHGGGGGRRDEAYDRFGVASDSISGSSGVRRDVGYDDATNSMGAWHGVVVHCPALWLSLIHI